VDAAVALASEPEPAAQDKHRLRRVLAAVWEPVEGRVGLAILAAFAFVVAFGPLIAPYDPYEIGLTGPNGPLSWDHLLGTDHLGRDVLSRLLYGARSVIGIPLLATTLAFLVGGLVGMYAGYVGGAFDAMASRVIDIMLSLPALLIVLVVIAALGSSNTVLVLSVAIVYSPRVARILRGATQGVASSEYVQAAQARGERAPWIVTRELLPNITPTVFVEFAVRLTYVIIFVATLNFLGLGVAPPSPNWGVMVAESRPTVLTAPVTTLAPALAIGLVSVGISLVADAVSHRLGLEGESEFLR
jgi:peptide/nickel transport system permease protein